MLNKVIRFSLNHKLTVLLAALLLAAAGVWSVQHTDVDVFPDLTAPTVVVMTDCRNMASEEVERQISFPMESALNGASHVRRIRSVSQQGASFVFVEFDWDMDPYLARQVVSEKLNTLSATLPAGVAPVLAPQSSVMGEIMFISLQVDTMSATTPRTSLQQLRTLAEWTVKPAILATGGVSQVSIIGGERRQYQVLADPVRMHAYGVTLHDLEQVAATFGANAPAGMVRDYGNEYTLCGVIRTSDIDAMGQSLVKMCDGRPVSLSDVADIVVGHEVRIGTASSNANPSVILSVSKQPDVNTLHVTRQIDSNLAAVRQSLPSDVHMDTHVFRQADFIAASVGNVSRALIEGALFVVLILLLFLGSFRSTVISLIAIPLSLLGTVLCLYLLDMEINTMTLGGMCIAIGSLVDDAIIDVENVYKHLRRNHQLPPDQRRSAYQVVFQGSSEIRGSIMHATIIIMLCFMPLFFLSGLEGRMLKPLGIAYIISLFTSLLVAMTVTPLLCKSLLSDSRYLERRQREPWLTIQMQILYRRILTWVLQHKRPVLYATVLLLLMSVGLLATVGRGFLPEFNEGSLTIAMVAQPGISLDESDRLGQLAERQLLAVPEVVSTARRTGRGELDEHSQATNGTEIEVSFRLDRRGKQAFLDEVRARLSTIPGTSVSIGQPLSHRIEHMVSGTQAAIAVKIFGDDLSQLYRIGGQIKQAVAHVEGLVDVVVEQQTEVPQIQVRPDRARMAQYGVTADEFDYFLTRSFKGDPLCKIYEGQYARDLVLRQRTIAECPSVDEVKDLLLNTSQGAMIPLSEIAEIVSAGSPGTISRENVQRKLVVSANVSGRDAVGVVDDIRNIIKERITLPEGYRIEYGGQFASAKKASRTLSAVFLLSLAIIYLLLYTEFKSWSLAGIVLVNLPLALIGGVVAVKLGGNLLSIPSVIGFITLFGIATRNGIILVSKYIHLQNNGQSNHPVRDIVLTGSTDRLNPIIMTALTTALSLIPMVLAADKAGNEIQAPMAMVVLGGLITSTMLNIFIVPIVYEWHVDRQNTTHTHHS
ncbi:MAG: AcrB/AcrD/AcrF family cation efflux system protein [bacterium P3]|nr:MAG: AcrB/AcrD/AcrF family cation efflux system protein [bacterium P3]KWW41461.1 MAG: AcrB/AcrD/AcrF family cation efflux system protein [bacterium F083]